MGLSRWADLPAELLDEVAAHLPPNEVACSVKLINKAAAKHLKSYSQVKLSQPVPQHAFACRWGRPDSTRDMTLKQRHHLLALTARSGVLANLQLAHIAAGCTLVNKVVLDSAGAGGSLEVCQGLLNIAMCCSIQRMTMIRSAAAAGHLHIVRWLLQQERATYYVRNLSLEALIAAAGAGQRAVCEGLLADEAPMPYEAVGAAFIYGHVALGEWLLREWLRTGCTLHPDDDQVMASLYSVVSSLDLASFQRLYALLSSIRPFSSNRSLIPRAIFSPTPDWRAKVTWLEQQAGHTVAPFPTWVFEDEFMTDIQTVLKDGPGALERLQLLRERGMLGERDFAGALLLTAARARNVPVLEYLVDNAINTALGYAVTWAVHDGNLDLLRELKARGGHMASESVWKAAYQGHLHVLQWMAGPEAGPEGEEALRQEEAQLTHHAALSGSVEVMRWLRERGCPWAQGTFNAAIRSGSVPLIEMLAAEGCPMQDYDVMRNACYGDLLTLTCLRRLGFCWDPAGEVGETFAGAIIYGCSPQQLQHLLDMGCPVDWQMARQVAFRERAEELRLWVEAQMQAAGIAPDPDGACSEGSESDTSLDSDEA